MTEKVAECQRRFDSTAISPTRTQHGFGRSSLTETSETEHSGNIPLAAFKPELQSGPLPAIQSIDASPAPHPRRARSESIEKAEGISSPTQSPQPQRRRRRSIIGGGATDRARRRSMSTVDHRRRYFVAGRGCYGCSSIRGGTEGVAASAEDFARAVSRAPQT